LILCLDGGDFDNDSVKLFRFNEGGSVILLKKGEVKRLSKQSHFGTVTCLCQQAGRLEMNSLSIRVTLQKGFGGRLWLGTRSTE
jgi:hypothetical protein